ncbi:MAG: hypothetical protein IGS39_11095 [Calothrix sp. C42_A2020_038]|nr:hypothetical protein [Calothrix sp. C42_A2020_038]
MLPKLVIGLFLAIILWAGLFANTASSQLIESRLNNLESNFNRLESRLTNIEAQFGRTSSQGRISNVPTQPQGTRARKTVTQSQRDQMFDRLVTLVVELQQKVNTLEQRVEKLEKR